MKELRFLFSEILSGTVWKTLSDPVNHRLFLECRNQETKRVSFYAFSLDARRWIWADVGFEESWWVTLAAVSGDVLLLTAYHDNSNPDRKSLFAHDAGTRQLLWFRNNFAVTAVGDGKVLGNDTQTGLRELILDLYSGLERPNDGFIESEQNLDVLRPFQYPEGSEFFNTVAGFLAERVGISPAITIEYREYSSFVIISAFERGRDLANYLFVLNSMGEIIVRETLGEDLKGLALDTFFIVNGYLIFVKNKTELVIWQFV